MRLPGGYAQIVDPDGAAREFDTFTCAHCNRITHVPARVRAEDIGGLCKQCMGLVCPACVGKPCVPFLKRLEQMEAKARFRTEICG
ncbi:MAG: hypothetical protein JO328_21310 [Hyphomicrobiales bacterium]|nr:hypothetical protein [Hyphomicrobiales bacterium]MBV9429105.1 hypothetical protein [Bradyrhizobiaceae bacterium]